MTQASDSIDELASQIENALTERDLTFTRKEQAGKKDAYFVIDLPGEKKLKTTTLLTVSPRGVSIEAFVCRHADENFSGVYDFLLRRNRKLYGVAYTIDNVGDIYLTGRFATETFTEAELDRVLGEVLQTADNDFNLILELGFSTSIKKEYKWRVSRGESLVNLKAFEHLFQDAKE